MGETTTGTNRSRRSEPFDLTGRVALVTGGNRGIGRAIALGLAGAGARVAVAARDLERSQRVADEIEAIGGQALALGCDVTEPADIRSTVDLTCERLGTLSILVNNAGVAAGGRPEQISDKVWAEVLDTNLKGAFLFAQAAFAPMQRAGGGKIINLGSEYALFGSAWVLPYSVSKGGVVQLTKSLAVAWAADNIQVNALIPGWIRTEMTAQVEQNDALLRPILERTPAGRFGAPEELAGAAIFLAAPASDFVTGIVLPVDGGYAAA